MGSIPSAARPWTIAGLAIALLGLPAIVLLFRALAVAPPAVGIVLREMAILSLVALLLWIILKRERLPLASIGLGGHGIGRSIGWGIAGLMLLGLGLVVCLTAFGMLGMSYGSGGGGAATPLWAMLLTVIRAGAAEEIFYRGYAIERMEALAGSRWVAAIVPLICFAGFHYRQGLAGIVLALVLGAILTALYLWKRNLLANIIAHFLVDFIPNIVLPLLGGE